MKSSKIGLKKIDGFTISLYKMQMEDYLYQKDFHKLLSGMKPDSMTMVQWKLGLVISKFIQLMLSKKVVDAQGFVGFKVDPFDIV